MVVTQRDAHDKLPANTRTPGGGTMMHSGTFHRQAKGGGHVLPILGQQGSRTCRESVRFGANAAHIGI